MATRWTETLKRTRNGAIYSETTSTIDGLDRHAAKRRKATSGKDTRLPQPCYLEALPVELLQQIFLTSMNGNLLAASPLIGVKLSGKKALYHAAFLLAFFSHDVERQAKIHKLNNLIPRLELPLSSWDIRSMTRAILASRWCTWGQVKLWLAANLRYVVEELLKVAEPEHTRDAIVEFMQGKTDLESLSGRSWCARDNEGRSWHVDTTMWDVRLVRHSDIYQNPSEEKADHDQAIAEDLFLADWRNDLVIQCQMRIFGVMTIGEEKMQNRLPKLHDQAPFLRVVEHYSGIHMDGSKRRPSSLDVWQLLETRAVRATRNAQWLRETLAIDYFFRPDDQPFKVSPRLYRAAAATDVMLERPVFKKRGSFIPALYVLYSIDPSSLPKDEISLLVWAENAASRLTYFRFQLDNLWKRVTHDREEGRLKARDVNRYRAIKLQRKFTYEMDMRIIRYIYTGLLEPVPDLLAPDFTEPLDWLGERLNGSVAALAEAEKADYPYADLRDVDIFSHFDDAHNDYHFEHELQTTFAGTLSFLPRKLQRSTSKVSLDDSAYEECHYALTTYDAYYRSSAHADYERYFMRPQHIRPLYYTTEDPERNIHYGEEPQEDQFDFPSDDPAIDWVVLGLDKKHPIPPLIKDTELAEPHLGPPKWFRAVAKPFFQELRHSKITKQPRRRSARIRRQAA